MALKLDDGSERSVDHALLATGYRFHLSHCRFLPPEIVLQISSAQGYPVLSQAMESSIPGLHFIGVAAEQVFGPSMRFVSGAAYCARHLARGVRGRNAPLEILAAQSIDPAGVEHSNAS